MQGFLRGFDETLPSIPEESGDTASDILDRVKQKPSNKVKKTRVEKIIQPQDKQACYLPYDVIEL